MAKRKKIKKSAPQRSPRNVRGRHGYQRTGSERKRIHTRTGRSFIAVQKHKNFASPRSLRQGQIESFDSYFDRRLRPEYSKFFKTHSKKGRRYYSFRAKISVSIGGQKHGDYISSSRREIRSQKDFEEVMNRIKEEFREYLDRYLTRMTSQTLRLGGVSMETLETPTRKKRVRKFKNLEEMLKVAKRRNANKSKKTKRVLKKGKKTVRRSRHRKR